MCNGCFQDCKKHAKDIPRKKNPRWVNVHKREENNQECCPVCKFDLLQYTPGHRTPSKFKTERWGPQNWLQGYISFWKKYFNFTKHGFNMRISEDSKLCHQHYMETYNMINNKRCTQCKSDLGLRPSHY